MHMTMHFGVLLSVSVYPLFVWQVVAANCKNGNDLHIFSLINWLSVFLQFVSLNKRYPYGLMPYVLLAGRVLYRATSSMMYNLIITDYYFIHMNDFNICLIFSR